MSKAAFHIILNAVYYKVEAVRCVRVCVLQARVMATIGVTRGLGDHDLKVYNSNIHIKPFLSCCPEVSKMHIYCV